MSSSELKLKSFQIPLKEINLATNNFSQDNYIGGGGFGKVYKGKLSESRTNRIAAIKRLDSNSLQGKHEFLNELSMLSSCNHKNIITFIGYCDEGDEMILVYEYAINQSLDQHLRNPNKMRCITWLQRVKICIDAATGLNYLHSGLGSHHRIIHRDIKSSNILLDDNLQAKITDFGLSKLGHRQQPFTQVYTRVAGTNYYCDPYYYSTYTLTKESDVYSFGVVLFEMLGGRLVFPKDNSPDLIQLVHDYYKCGQDLNLIIDPHIWNQIDPISLSTFMDIAYKCIDYYFDKRPTMDIIIKKLEEALKSQENHDFKELIPREISSFAWPEMKADKENHELEELIQKELYSFMRAEISNERADKVWEQRLPHDHKEIIKRSDAHVAYTTAYEIYSLLSYGILIDRGNKWFCLSTLNGKNCVVISAMELFEKNLITGSTIAVMEQLKDKLKGISGWKTIPGSRFVNVREFQDAKDLYNIKMQITIRMLSLETTYAVYLICKPSIKSSTMKLYCMYGREEFFFGKRRQEILDTYLSEVRDDEWMELELFHFTNHMETAVFEFRLQWDDYDEKYGVFVEGIEFRPIDMTTGAIVEELPKSELDKDWEKMLPNCYEEIIKRSNDVLHYTTKKQLYYLLAKGVFIDDNLMWFRLDTSNGKICAMLSPKMMTIKRDQGKFSIDDTQISRFSWAAMKFSGFGSLEIGGEIKARMLSPKTPYTAWLVFKCGGMLDYTYGHNIAWLTLGKQEQKTRRVHLGASSYMIRPLNDPKAEKGLRIYGESDKMKLDRRPRKRDDGWKEVELFPFYNDMDAHDEVKVGLNIKHKYLKFGFELQGIEFRPQGT